MKQMIESCAACQAVGPSNSPKPMRITPTATEPWQSLAIDFYGPVPRSGQYLLVVIDTYSKFPEVEIVKSTSAKACIPKLDRIFATHGIPQKIRTDNGPPFNGDEFKRYMEALGIEWRTSTPLWPQANGNAESIMKPIGKVIKNSHIRRKKLETRTSEIFDKLSVNTARNNQTPSVRVIVQSEDTRNSA